MGPVGAEYRLVVIRRAQHGVPHTTRKQHNYRICMEHVHTHTYVCGAQQKCMAPRRRDARLLARSLAVWAGRAGPAAVACIFACGAVPDKSLRVRARAHIYMSCTRLCCSACACNAHTLGDDGGGGARSDACACPRSRGARCWLSVVVRKMSDN